MTSAHQVVGWIAAGVTLALLAAATWSWVVGRRSGGRRDHRFAVDRLVLGVEGALAVGIVLGAGVFGSGGRPGDLLHLLYGGVSIVVVPVGWAIGGRRSGAGGRVRRDAWIALAAAVLLGVELRLFLTA